MFRMFCLIFLLNLGCGDSEDPSTQKPYVANPGEKSFNTTENSDNSSQTTIESDVKIENLSVRVFRDPSDDGCRVVSDSDGACPKYEISFAIKNESELGIDRVNGLTLNFNDRFTIINVNFTCDLAPWVVAAGASSGVVDLSATYANRFEFEYVCGRSENATSSFEREWTKSDLNLGPKGVVTGTLELRLTGLYDNASKWSSYTSTTF